MHIRHSQIDGHPGHVQAVAGNLAVALAKGRIGPGRTVARDDVVGAVAFQLLVESEEQVEQVGVDLLDQVGPVVAKQVIDLLERLGDVIPIGPVHAVERLARIGAVQMEPAFFAGFENKAGTVPPVRGDQLRCGSFFKGCNDLMG
jgi:hypothetical protein